MNKVFAFLLLFLAACFFAGGWFSSCNTIRSLEQQLQEVHKGSAVKNRELLNLIARYDSSFKKLEKAINAKTQAAVYFEAKTKDTVFMPVLHVLPGKPDTVRKADTVFVTVWPSYDFRKSDKWLDVEGTAGKDSVSLTYQMRAGISIAFDKIKWNSDSVRVRISSDNPRMSFNGKTVYTAPAPKPKRLAWFGVGVGIGLIGGFILHR